MNTITEYLSYNPETGILTWIKRPNKQIYIGTRAGSLKKDGYRTIHFQGKTFQEHRLIWYLYYGEHPKGQIDHINQIRHDNRIINLRDVSKSENARNRSQQDSRLKERGIWYCKRRKRYIAEIRIKGKKIYQASFTDIDEAIQQRQAKEKELGLFHYSHLNPQQEQL